MSEQVAAVLVAALGWTAWACAFVAGALWQRGQMLRRVERAEDAQRGPHEHDATCWYDPEPRPAGRWHGPKHESAQEVEV